MRKIKKNRLKGHLENCKLSVASNREMFFIMDDVTYCPVDPSQVPGNEY